MGPRLAFGLGHARALTRHRRVIHSPRAASLPHMIGKKIVSRWSGSVEIIRKRTPSPPTEFGIRTAPRNNSEAASLKTLGPYVQSAHNLRGYIGGCFPLCTFSLVRFFDVRQRNEHIERKSESSVRTILIHANSALLIHRFAVPLPRWGRSLFIVRMLCSHSLNRSISPIHIHRHRRPPMTQAACAAKIRRTDRRLPKCGRTCG